MLYTLSKHTPPEYLFDQHKCLVVYAFMLILYVYHVLIGDVGRPLLMFGH